MTLFSVSVVFICGCGSPVRLLAFIFSLLRRVGLVPLEFASNFKPLSQIIERLYSFSVRYRSNCYEKLLENFIFLHSLSNSEKMLLCPLLSSCLFCCAFVI